MSVEVTHDVVDDTVTPRRRRWPWLVVAVLVVAAGASYAVIASGGNDVRSAACRAATRCQARSSAATSRRPTSS